MKSARPNPERLKKMVKEHNTTRNEKLKDRYKLAHADLLNRKMELAKKKAKKEQAQLMEEILTEEELTPPEAAVKPPNDPPPEKSTNEHNPPT